MKVWMLAAALAAQVPVARRRTAPSPRWRAA